MSDLIGVWEAQLSEQNEENIELFIQGIKSRLRLMDNMFKNVDSMEKILLNPDRMAKMADRDLVSLYKIHVEGVIKMHDQLINDQKSIREIIKKYTDDKGHIKQSAKEAEIVSDKQAIKLLKLMNRAKNEIKADLTEPSEES